MLLFKKMISIVLYFNYKFTTLLSHGWNEGVIINKILHATKKKKANGHTDGLLLFLYDAYAHCGEAQSGSADSFTYPP